MQPYRSIPGDPPLRNMMSWSNVSRSSGGMAAASTDDRPAMFQMSPLPTGKSRAAETRFSAL